MANKTDREYLNEIAIALHGWPSTGPGKTYLPDELPGLARRLRAKAELWVAAQADQPVRFETSLPCNCAAQLDTLRSHAGSCPMAEQAPQGAPRGRNICQCLCSACASCTGDELGEDDEPTTKEVG